MIQICITSKEKSLFNQPLSYKLCNDIFDRHKMYEFTLWKKLISFTQPSANKPFLPYSIRAMNSYSVKMRYVFHNCVKITFHIWLSFYHFVRENWSYYWNMIEKGKNGIKSKEN